MNAAGDLGTPVERAIRIDGVGRVVVRGLHPKQFSRMRRRYRKSPPNVLVEKYFRAGVVSPDPEELAVKIQGRDDAGAIFQRLIDEIGEATKATAGVS